MQDFNIIEKLWSDHSVEVKISSEDMLTQAKREVNGLKRRSAYSIALMAASFIALGSVWFFYNFESFTGRIGLGITSLAVLIYTIVLYRDHRMFAKKDFTLHPQEFLDELRKYQLHRFQLYNQGYWFYVISLSVGIAFYFFEILGHFTFFSGTAIVLFTFGWMVFCSTIVRRAVIKREKERIALLIEKFERLQLVN